MSGNPFPVAEPPGEGRLPEPVRILVVDDHPENVLALTTVLESPDRVIVSAQSGREALRELLKTDFALVLLDVNMPGMDGFETAQLIRGRPASSHTPIIFVTAHHDEVFASRSYALGAVDYISAPVQPDVLRAKVGVFVELFRKTQENRYQGELLRQAEFLLRLQAEERLRQADERLRLIVDSLDDYAIFSLDLQGRIATWNAGAERLFGHPDSRAVGAPAGKLLLADDEPGADAAEAGFSEPGVSGGRRDLNAWFERADGQRFFGEAVVTAMHGSGDRLVGLSCVVHDITDRKRAEQALRRKADELTEANRLKDEFLAVLSHELRTPLNAILGWTQVLQRDGLDPALARQALDAIGRNGQMQLALINDILDVSRFVTGKIRLTASRVDLRAVARAAAETVAHAAAAKRIRFEFALGEAPLDVMGDPERLQQAMWNLVSNAVKFTPEGGRVTLEGRQDTQAVSVSVRDNGIGIRADFLPYVFDRFRQADSSTVRAHGGLGLGLAIVRHLVELHGGVAVAESAGEGQGAALTLRFPRCDASTVPLAETTLDGPATPAVVAADDPPSPTRYHLPRLRCLVVDDDLDARMTLKAVLEYAGVMVTVAESAAAAIELVADCDLLVADLGMPGEDGYSLIRRIRHLPQEQGGRVPAIAVTAYASEKDRDRALSEGFDRHLAKPVDQLRLVETIDGLLRESTAYWGPE
jgi:PAS domain S-box-containing protein